MEAQSSPRWIYAAVRRREDRAGGNAEGGDAVRRAGQFHRVSSADRIRPARDANAAVPCADLAQPIPLAHTFTAFFFAVVTGASRFAHTDWLRGDRALHALLGIARFPGDDTVRAFFRRFTPGRIEAFWRPLWRWSLALVTAPPEGFNLDLDSTLFFREGQQEGARKGYNPRRNGRKSHHPT